MADIGSVKLPSGAIYNFKDTNARAFEIVVTESGGTTTTQTADKTYDEILEAYNAHKFIYIKYYDKIIPLIKWEVDQANTRYFVFELVQFVGNSIIGFKLYDDDTLEIISDYGVYALYEHSHGNITNGGDITKTATIASGDRLVINKESASKITNSSITFGTNTNQYLSNNGTWENISSGGGVEAEDVGFSPTTQSWQADNVATALNDLYTHKADDSAIPLSSTTTPAMDGTADVGTQLRWARGDHVHPTDTSRAASSHTHGNITNAGALQTTDISIANGDKLVVTDSSNSNKIARTSLSFDGSTTSQALTKKGTWGTFLTSHQSLSAYAKLASPTFTGTPKAPTASKGTNTTQIATTAFVMNEFTPSLVNTGLSAYSSRCTIVSGSGYYKVGKMVFVQLRITVKTSLAANDYWTMVTGFPAGSWFAALSIAQRDLRGGLNCYVTDAGDLVVCTNTLALANGVELAIGGWYTAKA